MARRHRSTDGRIESIRDFVQRSLFLSQPRQDREEKDREYIRTVQKMQPVEQDAESFAEYSLPTELYNILGLISSDDFNLKVYKPIIGKRLTRKKKWIMKSAKLEK